MLFKVNSNIVFNGEFNLFLVLGFPIQSYELWKHTSKRDGGKPGV